MAFTPSSSTWLGAGFTVASNQVRLNTADAATDQLLTKVTDAEASADVRDLFRALCYMMYDAWLDQGAGNRPTKMTLEKDITSLAPTTTNPQVLRERYVLTFDVLSDPQDVISEP